MSLSIKASKTSTSMGWWSEVGGEGVFSGKARASGIVRGNAVGVEKSKSEG